MTGQNETYRLLRWEADRKTPALFKSKLLFSPRRLLSKAESSRGRKRGQKKKGKRRFTGHNVRGAEAKIALTLSERALHRGLTRCYCWKVQSLYKKEIRGHKGKREAETNILYRENVLRKV